MILLSARELCRQYDVDPVFRGVSFDIRPGEKIGLVGPNGCGKTSLMQILAGRDHPDVGTVERHPSARMALLEQQGGGLSDRSLRAEVQSGLAHLYQLQHEAHALAERMARAQETELVRLHERYDQLHHELERLDAYHIEHRVDEVLHGLGFAAEDSERPLSTFSGGQQNRAQLGRLLLAAPDVLLLDEPTNHLDIAATEWLEEFLARSPQAVLVVSHDRMFLDHVTGRTIELWQGGITDYAGNFTAYWQQRDERLKVLRRTYEKQQDFIEKTKDFIARNKSGQKSAQAKDREKKLERVELVEIPPDFSDIPMGFVEPQRTGDWVIRADGVSKGFGSSGMSAPLFSELTLQIDRGDRIGILGPNGSGKTTLLRTLLGELSPDTGSVRFGTGVLLGYFDQQLNSVDPALDAVEAIRAPEHRSAGNAPYARGRGTELAPGEARGLLARFGIKGELALQRVGTMSGGERTKVALARLHALGPNVMFLDEPTNHLDFWACAALERSLRAYEGTVLFVSHDRYFIDRVATKVLVLEPERWRLHEGNYSDYQAFVRAVGTSSGDRPATASPRQPAPATPGTPAPARERARRKRRFPYRKAEEIEADILMQETLVARLEAELSDPGVHRNGHRMRQIQQDYAAAQTRLAELLEHWEEAVDLN
jgi:ATP-binding cassette subfamily F protein 3